jgi:hypothetical protein
MRETEAEIDTELPRHSPRRHLARILDALLIGAALLAFVLDLLVGVKLRRHGVTLVLPTGRVAAIISLVLLGTRQIRAAPSLTVRSAARSPFDSLAVTLPAVGEWISAALFFSALTAMMLWGQARAYTSVPDLGDPLFSMWRLGWVVHQLPRDPSHLFDANIFHPATRTLAYSDAMLFPSMLSAPAIWLGVPLAAVYTTILLMSFVAAGVSMFGLVKATTENAGAAVIAGIIFAFDPFRFAHYSHLELECTFFMPLALLFLIRLLKSGRLRDGAVVGVCVALEGLSSLYYGAYLSVSLAAFVLTWTYMVGRVERRVLTGLALAMVIAGGAALSISRPYVEVRKVVGERSRGETLAYSATSRDYLTAPGSSDLYGTALWDANDGERKLFPGTVPAVLAATAVMAGHPLVVPAVASLLASVDASLGLNGTLYSWLYDDLPPFRAFRVPARFREIVGLYLAFLAGLGVARMTRRIRSVSRQRAVLAVTALLLLVDLHETVTLLPLWDHAPGIYNYVPEPNATVADLPLPTAQDPFWHDPVFMYFSTFHWHPLINGNSGFTPSWYGALGAVSREFPSDTTLDAYERLGTDYFVLHEGYYGPAQFRRVVADVDAQPRLVFVATITWEEGECRLYRFVK